MSDDRRMIEDYIPVAEISAASVREKLGGHHLSRGQIRNLHLWWARRPLAASRAAVYATFAPPATEDRDREALPRFFAELCAYRGPVLPVTDALKKARSVVSTAANGRRPRVLDMFAGGGAIPLEALRLGADAVAVELNPVAHLIQRCTLEFPQRYGKRLRDAVDKWGHWVIDQARGEVGDLYPDIAMDGKVEQNLDLFGRAIGGKRVLRPIAFLWTRTIPSTARGYEQGMVPLVRQTWLSSKAGNFAALRPVVDRAALRVRYELVTSSAKTAKAAIAEWGFDPDGSSVRGSTTCPFSGANISADDAKVAGMAGRMGAQLLATVCVEADQRGKVFLGAQSLPGFLVDEGAISQRVVDLCSVSKLTVPDEPLPEKLTGGMCSIYGLDNFGKLFTPRQQLTLLTFCKHTQAAHERLLAETGDSDFSAAVAAYLGLLVGRVADRGSTLCRWESIGHKTVNTYSRQALPMMWDFSEACPFGGGSGDAANQLDYILEVVDHAVAAAPERPAEVVRGLAQQLPFDAESMDAVISDPPYYDNISYADLSDFFYVWHKRALGRIFPALYATSVTPKKAEAVAAPHRHGNSKEAAAVFYEDQMRQAFVEAHRVLKPGCPMVVVYAHKTTLGWSTLIDSLRNSGFQVTEAWPLATERPDRAGQMNTASLASSIFLVARKRPPGGVGNYATEVRPEMTAIVQARVHDLMQVGIGGADLVIAAVGAGLRPYTRYASVELPNGDPLPADRFLEEVQREVLESVLAEVFEVDRSGVGQVDRTSRFYVLARYQYGLEAVEFGQINVLAQGLGMELTGAGSVSDGRRRLVEQKKSEITVLDFTTRGAEPSLGLPTGDASPPLVDVLHRLLWLVENDRVQVGPFLDKCQTDTGRLRLLANALKGKALSGGRESTERTDEQKAIDRLLAQWQRVVESRSMPLFEQAR